MKELLILTFLLSLSPVMVITAIFNMQWSKCHDPRRRTKQMQFNICVVGAISLATLLLAWLLTSFSV